MAVKTKFVIEQGTDFSLTIPVKLSDNSSANLTGYTARSQLRKNATSANNKVFTVTVNVDNVLLQMTNDYTSNIASGQYLFDVELVSAANVVTRLIEGTVTVTSEITR